MLKESMDIEEPEIISDVENYEIVVDTDDPEPEEVWNHSLAKTYYYKIVNYSVKDLLQSVPQDDHFIIRHTPFVFVQLCGTIVWKKTTSSKLFIEIDDGTGSISCSLDLDFFDRSKSINYHHALEDQSPENHIIMKGITAISSSLRKLEEVLPKDEQDLKIGDVVFVEGKLSQQDGTFHIFVEKLNKKDISDFIMYLQKQKLFYKDIVSE